MAAQRPARRGGRRKVRKNIPFGGRRLFEISVDIFNPFNFVQWAGDLGLSTTLANWQPGLPTSRRTMPIGTRFSF